MPITRRLVLTGTATLLAATALPPIARRAWAISSFELGDLRIDSLSDGHLELPAEFFLTSRLRISGRPSSTVSACPKPASWKAR